MVPARCGQASLKSVAKTVERFDTGKLLVHRFELLAQAFDMAVDSPVINIDLLVIRRIHKLIARLDYSWPFCQRL